MSLWINDYADITELECTRCRRRVPVLFVSLECGESYDDFVSLCLDCITKAFIAYETGKRDEQEF